MTESKEAFVERLARVATRETSADPGGWTQENPLWGHCAVATAMAVRRFGGTPLRASLEHVPQYAHMRSHYAVRLMDGSNWDPTRTQFLGAYPEDLAWAEVGLGRILGHAPTLERFRLLSWLHAKDLHAGNPLFGDPFYEACYRAAVGSMCQKMHFGSVLVREGEIVSVGCNAAIEPMKEFCEPTCVRLSMRSRTESMIGACGHAEESAIWNAVHACIRPDECDLYVAGVCIDGSPWIKSAAEHTCLRCAPFMHQARIKNVWVPVGDRWESLSTEQAVQTAIAYATGRKTV